ncbi:hypothetical protein CD039_04480 [Staphylococcus argensis]|uniref:Uncharacterized protein n=1 Tax=Staphylococcus argensis TaxID=1607738 RepID=A0A2K4FF82_9STAP|nr:hypothetical protein CD039_04480 [Staphylococcus argensis]
MELPLYFNLYHSIITCSKAKEILEVRARQMLTVLETNASPREFTKFNSYQKAVGDVITNRFTSLFFIKDY